jgi:thymidylate synthase
MDSYHNIVQEVLDQGQWKKNRTGVPGKTLVGLMFSHDMSLGFPLLTTKKVPFSLIASELEFFIQGRTDKGWLQERKNHIWDEWATPRKVSYGHSPEEKQRMLEEKDLGPIYGFQWRHFNAPYKDHVSGYPEGVRLDSTQEKPSLDGPGEGGVDQLAILVERLKNNPDDRRMLVVAWNPAQLHHMALPPCHYCFQVTVLGGKLNLLWNQRSVDVMLGLPFNIASYGLLLHLLAKESGLKEGKLVGFLSDVHIYENHLEGAVEQLGRDPNRYPLPTIETSDFTGIFSWSAKDSKVLGYRSYPGIPLPIAI